MLGELGGVHGLTVVADVIVDDGVGLGARNVDAAGKHGTSDDERSPLAREG
jgi:hypothetical protein